MISREYNRSSVIKAVIFGGTTEGRRLCEFCAARGIPIVYCVATRDGARYVGADSSDYGSSAAGIPIVNVRVGRMDAAAMRALFLEFQPLKVIDATHPYALVVGENIKSACLAAKIPMFRVLRADSGEASDIDIHDCKSFATVDDITDWLNSQSKSQSGNIFVAAGASIAKQLTGLHDYKTRVWLRILPGIDGLRMCLDLGYSPKRIVCMRGPFSEELNRAMFIAANARVLVTKNSGAEGGFPEKLHAARSLGMSVAVLSRPFETGGVTLEEAKGLLAPYEFEDAIKNTNL